MKLDLHRVLARKQERECAKADEFAFRARARAMRLFGEWLRDQGIDVDPVGLATATVLRSDNALFEELRRAHGGDRHSWRRAFERARAAAEIELREQLGDPTPHRLA